MPKTQRSAHLTRRRFLQLLTGLTLTTGAMAGYIRLVEPHWLSVEQVEIPIRALHASLDGKRVAQLSDIHLSDYFASTQLAAAITRVIDYAPDWLVLTGDFVGDHAGAAEGLVEPLRSLPLPTYAIFGNHDYWSDRPTVEKYLRTAGVRPLVNEAQQLDTGLWLAGVDDLWSGRPDLRRALRDVPQGAATILLAHEPDYFDTVLHEEAPVALQVSGHSHGGQIRFPSLTPDATGNYSYAPVLPQYGRRYPIGLRQIDGRYVYTNRGLGLWPLPYRFNCRPELTIFTLRSA